MSEPGHGSEFEGLTNGLRGAGVELTHQRLEMCREIANAATHPDAESEYGEAHDFYCADFDQLSLPRSVTNLGIPNKTQVEVRGICRKCLGEPDGQSSS